MLWRSRLRLGAALYADGYLRLETRRRGYYTAYPKKGGRLVFIARMAPV